MLGYYYLTVVKIQIRFMSSFRKARSSKWRSQCVSSKMSILIDIEMNFININMTSILWNLVLAKCCSETVLQEVLSID